MGPLLKSHPAPILLFASAFVMLAACGCDGGAFMRMDIREGTTPGFSVVPVAEFLQLDAPAISGARVAFEPSRGLGPMEASRSGPVGVVSTGVLVYGMPVLPSVRARLKVAFTCTKDGYEPVSGVFGLQGFGWSPPRQTVLVTMKRSEPAAGPDAAQ
jgi:hypothetical protein